ncbi:MAG: hypothetical protein ACSLFC_11645 [Desulfuromonadales bacterium]
MKNTGKLIISSIVFLALATTAQAAEPEQTKPARLHAILGQWHGSSYSGGEFSVAKIYTADRWRQFWLEYLGREQPVNFDESLHQAVYIELGVRRTAGTLPEASSLLPLQRSHGRQAIMTHLLL